MPESAVAEPPASSEVIVDTPPNTDGIDEPGFGNLTEAFDKAFPSTAKKPETEPPPAAPAPETPPPAPEPKADTPPPTAAASESQPGQQTVPEAIFGDKKEESPVAPEPKIEVPSHIKDPKQIKNFEQMRDLYEDAKRKLIAETNEFARKLAEARATAVDPGIQATIDTLKREKQELLQIVERKSVEDHPRFRQEITAPRAQALKEARQLLEYGNIEPKQLDKALALQGPAQVEALDEIYGRLPESSKAELAAAVLQIRRLDNRREDILKNASGTAEKLRQQDTIGQHERLQQQEQQMLKLADAAVAHLRDKAGFEVFVKSSDPKDGWWNEQVEERLTDMRRLLTKEADPAQHALAAGMAVAAPFYRDFAIKMRTENLALKAELAAIKGAEPRLDGGGETSVPSDDDSKLTFAESVTRNSGLR